MTNQETLKRVKVMDFDFGEGQTLRGLIEDMERESDVLNLALDLACEKVDKNCEECVCERCYCNMECAEAYREGFIRQAESEIEKE